MDDMSAKLADQLKRNPKALQALMRSGDGQSLMRKLSQEGGLQEAARAAAQGSPGQLAEMVQRLMRDPEGAALVERINRAMQK